MSEDTKEILKQDPINPSNLEMSSGPIMDMQVYLNQFVFMIYMVNPIKDNVRVILDDGAIKFFMKRDRFRTLMENILNETLQKEYQHTLFRIKSSLSVYGGIFYFDKINNVFKEIIESPDIEKIKPSELIMESRRTMVREVINQNFKDINREYNEKIIDKIPFISENSRSNNKFFSNIIRSFTKR